MQINADLGRLLYKREGNIHGGDNEIDDNFGHVLSFLRWFYGKPEQE